MNAEFVERLELKIAFLERASAELSDVVYAQQREIDALRQRVAELANRLEASGTGDKTYTAEEEKPPHY